MLFASFAWCFSGCILLGCGVLESAAMNNKTAKLQQAEFGLGSKV